MFGIQKLFFRSTLVFPSFRNIHLSRMTSQKTKVAVVQLNSKENKEDNFKIAKDLIDSACKDGAKMAFLPECFDMIGTSREMTFANAEPLDGPLIKRYEELARSNQMW